MDSKYICCSLGAVKEGEAHMNSCGEHRTPKVPDGGLSELAKTTNLECPAGGLVTRLELVKEASQYFWKFRCCQPGPGGQVKRSFVGKCKEAPTEKRRVINQMVSNMFQGHDQVKCKFGAGLSSWKYQIETTSGSR